MSQEHTDTDTDTDTDMYTHPSGITVIQITKHETFLRGNIIKYVLRAPYSGEELKDLKKAAVYLQWEIEHLEGTKE